MIAVSNGRLAPKASNGGFGGHFARTFAQE